MLLNSSPSKILLTLAVLLLITSGCNSFQTSYFGVEDEAIFSPDSFGKTEKMIEQAKKDVDSDFARKRIDAAMRFGRQAAQAYWEGFEEESEVLLAKARQTAMQAELDHDQPPPQYVSRIDTVVPAPYPPNRLFPDSPKPVDAPANPLIVHRVFFTPGSPNLHPGVISRLNDQLPLLKSKEALFFEIAGFASPNEFDADELSKMRARSVFDHLVAQGIKRNRMTMNAYGQNDACGQPGTDMQENCARVEIRLLDKSPEKTASEGAQEQYTIQVAAFQRLKSAEMKRDQLIAKGYPAYSIKAQVYNKIWYRVRIGPYESRDNAEAVFKELKSEGYEAILLRLDEGEK